jgi:uncharacterized membrane protein YkvA (DUF1232 family)
LTEWAAALISVVGGVVLLWGALIALLWLQQRRSGSETDWREILRLVPDVVRLVKRLGTDRAVGRGTRICLLLLLIYLLSPIDLIPDFIPVLGYADDAIIVALALRFATRHAGREAIERNWPGTAAGLRSVLALAGVTA